MADMTADMELVGGLAFMAQEMFVDQDSLVVRLRSY
jgi:hypothetical protein